MKHQENYDSEIITKHNWDSNNTLPYLLLPPVLCVLSGYVIYLPVINRYFVSDDFSVLKRVCLDHVILIKGFFRPLSDLTILMNFEIDGLNPIIFNAFNILIHGINTYLLYLICLNFGRVMAIKNKVLFAIVSAAFFLSYPFHNEAVVWLLGRGSSIACLFALLSIVCYYKINKKVWKVLSVCGFYFISMLAFESTILFPLSFIFILIFEKKDFRSIQKWSSFLILTCCSHMLFRYFVSGSILGNYGSDFFHTGIKTYLLNAVRIGGRLIFPPSSNPGLFLILFIIALLFITYISYKNWNKFYQSETRRMFLFLTEMLISSCIIPLIIGVSIRTSETDRLLYFPSVFLCMILAITLLNCISKKAYRLIAIGLIFVYNLFFLEKNNLNWIKASEITHTIVEEINGNKNQSTSYFLNIPKEINGAFVFRIGFIDAVHLCGQDDRRFIAVNYLGREEIENMRENKKLEFENSKIVLSRDIHLESDSSGCKAIYDRGILKFVTHPGDVLYVWNPDHLNSIPVCRPQFRH